METQKFGKSLLAHALLAAMDHSSDPFERPSSRVTSSSNKSILTPKQKKQRAKAKSARKARRANRR